ncbi:MAG: DUF4881 domain-containing protein [Desulfovibrionaceae bacterium]|nr:DUF4881 domain-containing protein [Desulfovibrionaceae bacterium]
MKRTTLNLLVAAACMLGLAACDFGSVDQGRTIAFNEQTQTVTIVRDVKHDQQNPEYTGTVVSYKLPSNPEEVGPLPKAGGRLKLDAENNLVIIFNPQTNSVERVPVVFTDIRKDIPRSHPLVNKVKFPVYDKEKNTVTEYSGRQKMLATFVIPQDKLALPESVWEAGDDVRVYYKENAAHQARRFMNVTKTNIFKK